MRRERDAIAAVIALGEDKGMDGYGGEDEELRGCPVSVLWSWLMRKRKKKGEGGCDCFT